MPHKSCALGKKFPFESLSTTDGTELTPQQGEELMLKGRLDADLSITMMVTNGSIPPYVPGYVFTNRGAL